MPPDDPAWDYDRGEMIADGVVHGIGVILGLAGAAVLLAVSFRMMRGAETAAVIVYVIGLLSMLGLSATYNLWPVSPRKWWLRRFDHAAIYLLIAATTTPFALHMERSAAMIFLALVWLTAAAGISLKLFWPRRFERTAIALYLAMGWSAALSFCLFMSALTPTTLWLLAAGGLIYSAGVVFHLWESLRFQNAIWHAFVLTAALCHYLAVLTSIGTA